MNWMKIALTLTYITFFVTTFFAQSPCDCSSLGTSNLCNGGYFNDYNSANSASNPYNPSPALTWTNIGDQYTFCTKYTAPNGVGKIGLLNYISSKNAGGSGCNFTRSNWTAYENGCSTPISGTMNGTNACEFPVTPGVEYRFCVTVTLDATCIQIEGIENYLYTAAPASNTSCTASIGSISVTGATLNGSEYDLTDGNTVTLTATGFTLPPNGGTGTCISTYGYFVFDQAPTLPITDITTIANIPGYKGVSSGAVCTDDNTTGKSSTISTANKLWYLPFVADCKKNSSTNKLNIDEDGDNCYAIGTSAFVVNYLSTSTAPCGDCNNPVCKIYLTNSPSASPSGTYPASNHITENATGPSTVQECHTVTVTNNNQTLGFRQSIYQLNNGCATRTFTLYATDANGHCTGSVIAPTRQTGSYSSIFNPEWDNLPAGNYVMCITQNLPAGCDIDYINTGYYLINLPLPSCPTDQSFIKLDWSQANPFIPYNPSTYTCSSPIDTIWKNVESTIGTAGELEAFPGFFMQMTTDANSPTNTSVLISVNGTPYSYYGPTGSAPANVLDWGPVTDNTQIEQIIEPYIKAGATVTAQICDKRATAQSFPYIVYDFVTGNILKQGTATPSSGNCVTITFTMASPTMTWKIDGSTTNITNLNNGSASFDPKSLSAGNHTITYDYTYGSCTISTSQTINVAQMTPLPTVVDTTYCQNATGKALHATAAANCTLNWYGTNATGGTASSTATIPSTTTAGTFTYYVSQTENTTHCESGRKAISVTVNATPTKPTVTTPVQYCQNQTTSALNATASINGTLNWYGTNPSSTSTNSAPSPSSSVLGNTNYYVSQTINGCEGPQETIIVQISNPSVTVTPSTCNPVDNTYSISGDLTFVHAPNSGTLTISTSAGGTPYTQNAPFTSPINYSITNLTSNGLNETVTVSFSSGACGTSTTYNAPSNCTVNCPTAAIAYNGPFCYSIASGKPVQFTGTGGGGTYSYTSTNNSTLVLDPNTGTVTPFGSDPDNYIITYTLAASGSCPQLITTTNLTITGINPPSVTSPVNYCQNASASALNATAISGATLKWYGNSKSNAPTNVTSIPGTATIGTSYYYVTQIKNGCESKFDSILVSIAQPIVPTFTIVDSLCEGSIFNLPTSSTNNPIILGTWSPSFNNKSTTTYTFTPNSGQCATSTTDSIYIDPKPTALFGYSPEYLTIDSNLLQLSNLSLNATNYSWDFGDGTTNSNLANPIHVYDVGISTESYSIKLSAYSKMNCIDTLTMQVIVFKDIYYFVPNTFTPFDGNNLNNVFKPVLSEYISDKDYSLYVVNRWGETIFESHDKTIGWDGTYNNLKCQEGTYSWKIIFSEINTDKKTELIGTVNLVR